MGILLSIYDSFKSSSLAPLWSSLIISSNISSSSSSSSTPPPSPPNSTFQSFPPDCISDILKFLDDDLDTLYSCLFVNRLWCRMTVPVLWSNPFRFNFNEKSVHLIHIYVSCLPEKDLNHLIKT